MLPSLKGVVPVLTCAVVSALEVDSLDTFLWPNVVGGRAWWRRFSALLGCSHSLSSTSRAAVKFCSVTTREEDGALEGASSLAFALFGKKLVDFCRQILDVLEAVLSTKGTGVLFV